MAIAVDVTSLGNNGTEAAASTIAFTTGSNVASGGRIVLGVGWWDSSTTLSSVAGGSLTWTIHAQGKAGASNMHLAIVSAPAPSGLASGTTITATMSDANAFIRQIAGISFTGIDTGTPVDVAGTAAFTTPAAAGWATGSLSVAAGSVVVGLGYTEDTNRTSTATAPSTEFVDRVIASAPSSFTGGYRIESGAGSVTVAGTWSSTSTSSALGVAFAAAAGGGGGTTVKNLAALGVG